mmetsp:Transcript_54396/g.115542  ORF Transcript_54396/g.115542 Transcript_54396/m.115542 type:complete len:216 (-) Transcript_54396:470-1117(-)
MGTVTGQDWAPSKVACSDRQAASTSCARRSSRARRSLALKLSSSSPPALSALATAIENGSHRVRKKESCRGCCTVRASPRGDSLALMSAAAYGLTSVIWIRRWSLSWASSRPLSCRGSRKVITPLGLAFGYFSEMARTLLNLSASLYEWPSSLGSRPVSAGSSQLKYEVEGFFFFGFGDVSIAFMAALFAGKFRISGNDGVDPPSKSSGSSQRCT